jgi:hypothetical protein
MSDFDESTHFFRAIPAKTQNARWPLHTSQQYTRQKIVCIQYSTLNAGETAINRQILIPSALLRVPAESCQKDPSPLTLTAFFRDSLPANCIAPAKTCRYDKTDITCRGSRSKGPAMGSM